MRHGNGVVGDVRSSDVEQPGDLVQGGDHVRARFLLLQRLSQARELVAHAHSCELDRMLNDFTRRHGIPSFLLPDCLHRTSCCCREHVRLQRLLQAPPCGNGDSRGVDAHALGAVTELLEHVLGESWQSRSRLEHTPLRLIQLLARLNGVPPVRDQACLLAACQGRSGEEDGTSRTREARDVLQAPVSLAEVLALVCVRREHDEAVKRHVLELLLDLPDPLHHCLTSHRHTHRHGRHPSCPSPTGRAQQEPTWASMRRRTESSLLHSEHGRVECADA
mmetsp:Transcript_26122/g.85890  ORF Transcript_26122/g.85890 Transcript_26122/m.85890 type:complete len:277 (-) Transcript_26122:77-907(-)